MKLAVIAVFVGTFVLSACAARVGVDAEIARESELTPPFLVANDGIFSRNNITIDDLATIRDVRRLVVSPDGRFVAFQVDRPDPDSNSYSSAWYSAPSRASAKIAFLDTAGPVNIDRAAYGNLHGSISGWPAAWSPDGRWLAYLKRKDGETQIWRVPRDGGAAERLTRNSADVVDLVWSADGENIYFVSGRDREFMANKNRDEALRGYLFDERIHPQLGPDPLWSLCEQDGVRFSLMFLVGGQEPCSFRAWVFEVDSESERKASRREQQEFWALRRVDGMREHREIKNGPSAWLVSSSSDGKLSAWLENADPKTYQGLSPPLTVLATIKDGRAEVIRCPSNACTGRLENVWVRTSTGEVIFHSIEGHAASENVLYSWVPGEEAAREILRTDDHFKQCGMGEVGIVCLYETWTSPAQIAEINLDSGEVHIIFDPNPEFTAFNFTRVEKIEWKGDQGHEALGHLVYPANYDREKRYPLVVVTYLCTRYFSFLRGGTGDEQPIHVFAQEGFAVLCFTRPFTPRKAAQQHKTLEENIKNYIQLSPLLALEELIDDLVARGLVDAQKIGVSGLSNGAILVEEAIVESDIFSAASAAWSPSHPVSHYILNSEKLRQIGIDVAGGPPFPSGFDYWTEKSPGIHADEVSTPLLLQVADVEIFSALPNFISLSDADRPVEMFIFPGEYHIKWQPAHKYAVYKRNLQWFKFWLQGVEESDPLDPEQYTRWRKMRVDHCSNMEAEGESQLPVDCEVVN